MRPVFFSTIVTNRHSIFEMRIHSFIFIVRYLFYSKVENRSSVYHSKSSTSNVYFHTHFFVVDQRVFVLNLIVVVLFCFYCVFACIHSVYLIANPYGSHNIVLRVWNYFQFVHLFHDFWISKVFFVVVVYLRQRPISPYSFENILWICVRRWLIQFNFWFTVESTNIFCL